MHCNEGVVHENRDAAVVEGVETGEGVSSCPTGEVSGRAVPLPRFYYFSIRNNDAFCNTFYSS